jgi:hypothetical protein
LGIEKRRGFPSAFAFDTTDKNRLNYSLHIKITSATLFEAQKTLIYQAFHGFA